MTTLHRNTNTTQTKAETRTYPLHNSGRNKAVGEDSSLYSFSLSLSLSLSLSVSNFDFIVVLCGNLYCTHQEESRIQPQSYGIGLCYSQQRPNSIQLGSHSQAFTLCFCTSPSHLFLLFRSAPPLSFSLQSNPNVSLISFGVFFLWQCTIIVLLTLFPFYALDELDKTIMPQVTTPSFKPTKFLCFLYFLLYPPY